MAGPAHTQDPKTPLKWRWPYVVAMLLLALLLLWFLTDKSLPPRTPDPRKPHEISTTGVLPALPFDQTPLRLAYQARLKGRNDASTASPLYPLTSAHDGFAARVYLIRNARRQLDLQYYIWDDDVVGRLLLLELQQAAQRGVRVRLLLDDNSTRGLDGYLSVLGRQPNFEIRLFNPFAHRKWRIFDYLHRFEQQQKRMHNKLLVADQTVMMTGGRNVGDSYFRPTPNEQAFTDLDLIAAGAPAVKASQSFEEFWDAPDSYPVRDVVTPDGQAESEALQLIKDSPKLPEAAQFLQTLQRAPVVQDLLDGRLQWIWAPAEFMSDHPDKLHKKFAPQDTVAGVINQKMRSPQAQIDLVSAYFIPTDAQVQELSALARKGVRVRVLTNSLASTDVPAVHAFYVKKRPALLAAGVRLFEYNANDPLPSFGPKGSKGNTLTSDASLHAKVFGWDKQSVFVGSFNYDPRSVHHNTECGLLVNSPLMAQEIDRLMDGQLRTRAYEVKLDEQRRLYWIDQTQGTQKIWHEEPNASLMDRALARAVGWLPIEQYM